MHFFFLLSLLAAPEALRVYTKPIEPFSFEEDGKAAGFSLELWQRVAQQLGLTYRLTWKKTVPELIEALESGQADVAVAAISITSDREKLIDFSTPYYESGLQILVGSGPSSSASALMNLFTWDFARLLGVLALALLVSSHLLWWFERRRNEGDFPVSYKHGVWESLWWTSSVLITGGCENKAPIGVGGRLVAVVYDAPVLLYRAAKEGGQMHVVGRLFEKQNYGIGLQPGSKYRKSINEVLLKLGEEGYLAELRRKYFGESE